MAGPSRDDKIRIIADMMTSDSMSPDEAEPSKLARYHNHAVTEFGMNVTEAEELIAESQTYIRIRNADVDPLSEGKKFGFGFS